jgi:hypothetical protein
MRTFKNLLQLLESGETYLGTLDHTKKLGYQDKEFDGNNLSDIHKNHKLTPDEYDNISDYAGHIHYAINKYLRGTDTPGKGPNYDKNIKISSDEHIPHIDSAIAKHTTEHPIHVWRGIQHNDAESMGLHPGNVGRVIHDKGYVSTSFDPGEAKAFAPIGRESKQHIIHIEVPKNSKALYLNNHSRGDLSIAHEHEVLLPRGSRFKYHGSTEHNNHSVKGDEYKTIIHHLTHIPEGTE